MSSTSSTLDIEARFDAYCTELESARIEHAVPGVGIGVQMGDKEFTGGLGVNNLEHPLPVDGDSLFQIGSTSKTFTATVAMQLVEAGKLELDEPIRTYLPDFRLADADAQANVTLRHLFTHTGGWIGDFFLNTGRGDDALERYVARMVDLRQENPLGAMWAYNNAGFNVAGLVIQKVCDKLFEDVVKEMLLEPLGMEMSFFFPEDALIYAPAVGHHTPIDGEPTIAKPWALTRSAYPAGGIVSNAKDQLRYARFHLGDGTTPDGRRLLKAETIRYMQQTQRKAASMAHEMGIGWLIRNMGGVRVVAHGGATTGQLSAFEMVPTHGFALTLTTNGSRGRVFNSLMVKKALEIFLDVQLPKPEPVALSPDQLAPYLGQYDAALSTLAVTAQDGGLVVASQPKGGFPDKDTPAPPAPPPAPFVFTGKDHIEALEGSMQGSVGDFLYTPDGELMGLHLGGRIYHKVAEG